MTDNPFQGLRRGYYGAMLIDCPWSFRTYGGDDVTPHRTAVDHYPVMSLDDIKRLPVAELMAPDCAVFLWVVDSHLEQAFEVGKAWGLTYKTRAFEWIKEKKNGDGYRMGLGYWTRKQCESVLLLTRGHPRRLSKGVRQIIEEPIRQHSRKPDEAYRRIEQLVAGPYVELFATQRWVGWDGWGRDYPPDLETALNRLTAAIEGWS